MRNSSNVVYFVTSKRVVDGVIVPVIGSGVVLGPIDVDGGTRQALLVQPPDGEARIVGRDSLLTVTGGTL